jgi:hypothetical protein
MPLYKYKTAFEKQKTLFCADLILLNLQTALYLLLKPFINLFLKYKLIITAINAPIADAVFAPS